MDVGQSPSGKEKIKITKQNLRKLFVNKDSQAVTNNPWLLELGYDSRDEAVQDFISALAINKKICKDKKKSNVQCRPFKMRCKSKKKLQECVFIRERHWNRKKGMYSWLRKIRSEDESTISVDYDTRIVKDSIGRIFVLVLKPLEPITRKSEKGNVLSLNPGVRRFMTGYDPQGLTFEFAKGDMGRIFRLAHHSDHLRAKLDVKTCKHQSRYKNVLAEKSTKEFEHWYTTCTTRSANICAKDINSFYCLHLKHKE
eukprot:gb/GECH01007789.1/.p1 GENE.gb/GECH01007789.1/~~gb/GECH01007789.1/.p1  ORF type:complete len:255 (+),score=10.97 gb/GECH01007789.1/:1-765(+)